jgi:hypothetical protein
MLVPIAKAGVFGVSICLLVVVFGWFSDREPLLFLPGFAGLGAVALTRGVERLRRSDPRSPAERVVNSVLDGPTLKTSERFGAVMQLLLGVVFLAVAATYGLGLALS